MTKRTTMQIDPEMFKMLKEWKDTIHMYASNKKVPLSWNTFFLLIIGDWKNSVCKCHCGKRYQCDSCGYRDKLIFEKARQQVVKMENNFENSP